MSKDSITSLLVDCVNIAYDLQSQQLKCTKFDFLSISELHVLEAIALEKEATMTNVANRLLITVGSLTTAINKLILKGVVERSRHEEDHRIVILKLTKSGQEALVLHQEIHEAIDDVIYDCIEPDMVEWVNDTIKEISKRLNDIKDTYK
ncbi:MAG: MarR family transcriptional regulator [Erysipelotrichaceae bacterium]|nr:MarR family transcriptional regulator [Erysipelotrichaceae bacterium]